MSELHTRSLSVDQLVANDWNPNQMSEEEFAELVAEVRHLGRLPKPLVVRPAGDRYVLVDGEHAWRAAQVVNLEQVACEVIDADDFEAMRQTYKRNQHGTHNPVLLGRMFKRMLEERGLSRRALAEETDVSEGTVRNMLLYAKASELAGESEEVVRDVVRNDYAPAYIRDNDHRPAIGTLSVSQVRLYLALPTPIGDSWLKAGADVRLLQETSAEVRQPGQRGRQVVYVDEDAFQQLVDAGLGSLYTGAHGFQAATELGLELLAWRSALASHLHDDVDAYLKPVAALLRNYSVSPDEVLHFLPLRQDGRWQLSCPIPPERWATILSEAIDNKHFVWSRLRTGVKLALKELDAWDEDLGDYENTEKLDPETRLALHDAPDFIRDAKISVRDKVGLAQATFPGASEEELLEVKQAAIPMLEAKHKLMAEGFGYVDAEGRGVGPMEGGRPLWGITPDKIVTGYCKKRREEQEREERKALFASRDQLVAAVAEQLASSVMGPWHERPATAADIEELKRQAEDPDSVTLEVGDSISERTPLRAKDGRNADELLFERLAELPWPELVLLACVVTGEGDPGEVWLRAVDGRDPATRGRRRQSLRDRERLAELAAKFRRMEARIR
jgi:ParB/RepB/Spo0J family partition protein